MKKVGKVIQIVGGYLIISYPLTIIWIGVHQKLRNYERAGWNTNKATLRNKNYWFKPGLTFSLTGIYAPTIRIKSHSMFDNKSSGIFSDMPNNFIISILCSKLAKFLTKNYLMHTVDTQVGIFNILQSQ